VPYIKQDEPLKLECQHFLECITQGAAPITNGRLGLEVVKILEASSESLRQQGASISLGASSPWTNGHQNGHANGNSKANGNGRLVVPKNAEAAIIA
jgi:hypothetical protein